MKQSLKLLAFILIGSIGLFSCNKNNPSDTEQTFRLNDADLLLNKVLLVDENNTITGTRGGLQLDESDPGQITVVAHDYAQAKDWFRFILPESADISESESELTWRMKDSLGVSQGQAVLKAVTGAADGRVAQVDVPVSARPLTGIIFVPLNALPMNDDLSDRETCDALDGFYLGAKVTLRKGTPLPEGAQLGDRSYLRGEGDFVVIQDYTVGRKDGILLRLEPGEQSLITDDTSKHFERASYAWTLDYVHDILKANPALHSNIKDMGMPDWDHQFLTRKNNVDQHYYKVNLKDTDKGLSRVTIFSRLYYEAWVYRFYVGRRKDGSYGVIVDMADWGYNDHH